MNWHQKVPYLLALVIGLAATLSAVSAASSEYPCDPTKQNRFNVPTGTPDLYNVLSVSNLKAAGSCVWSIGQALSNSSYLDLTSVYLDTKDVLNITGTIIGDKNTTTTKTLFTSTGTPVRGLVRLSGYNTVNVTLTLVDKPTVLDRAFYSVYYWSSSSPVQLQEGVGELTFPLNTPDKTSALKGGKLEVVPGIQFDGQLVLFNITQLPTGNSTATKVTVDGVPVNATTTTPKVFLQDAKKPTVSFTFDLEAGEPTPITIRWWLVSAACSETAVLKVGDKARPIRVPDSGARNARHQSAVRCGMVYSTDAGNKLLVQVPTSTGLAAPGDSVNFIDGLGNVALGLNGPAVMYFGSGVDTVIETPSALVLYESPYVSGSATTPSAAYQPPVIKAIPSAQASEIILTKDTSVEVKFSKEETSHLVISLDQTKHVQILFPPAVKLNSGDVEIKLFNSESSNAGVAPIATLGQYSRLPVSVVSGGPMLRATFKLLGKQAPSTPFTVTYRLVEANSTCGRLSTLAANFEVKSGAELANGPCTWYIPASSAASSVVLSPATIDLPAETRLTLTDFTDLGAKPFTVAGPFSGAFFPDLVLAAKSVAAYELSVESTSKNATPATTNGLHVLVTAKPDNFIPRNSSFSAAERSVRSVSSINYPGAYPVGAPSLSESWNFIGGASDWAVVSFEDIHLAKTHTLFLTAQGTTPINFSGEQNMTTVPDFLVKRPFFITQEVNSPLNLTSEAKRGFKATLRYPAVAAEVAITKETALFFNTSSASAANPLAIWHVVTGAATAAQSDTILHVNVTLAEGLAKSKASLAFVDSISMRPGGAHWANGSFTGANLSEGHFIGSIRSLWIVYDYSASDVGKVNLTASFVITPEKCTNSKNYTLKCATVDRCITDPMVCNGLNECGDWTDELYCKGSAPPAPPAPPAPVSGGGVNTLLVIFLLMPMSAILGIVGYIYLPQFLMRIRRGRYSEFRDLSEVS